MGFFDSFKQTDVEKMQCNNDVDGLIKALKHNQTIVREKAAKALGELKNNKAVTPLSHALNDQSQRVQKEAALALSSLGDAQAVDSLIRFLNDEDGRAQQEVFEALRNMGLLAVEPLSLALKDMNVGHKAARILGLIGDVSAVDSLIGFWTIGQFGFKNFVTEKYFSEEEVVEESLRNIGAPAVEPLARALKHANEGVRYKAARVLGLIGDARAVEPLIQSLNDTDGDVRANAAWALEKIGADRAIESLFQSLNNTNGRVREVVVRTLEKIGDTRAIELLIQALKDEFEQVRMKASEALGKIGDARAVEPLICTMIYDKFSEVRNAAAEALLKISNPAIWVDPLICALKHPDSDTRKRAAETLDRIQWKPQGMEKIYYLIAKQSWAEVTEEGELAVEPLIQALKDKENLVRGGVAEALGKIGDTRAVEPLCSAIIYDVWPPVQRSACEALGKIGYAKIVDIDILIAGLKHSSRNDGRQKAAELLGEIGDARAVEPLIMATMIDDVFGGEARNAATKALLKIINNSTSIDPLIVALKHKDCTVKREVAAALDNFQWKPQGIEKIYYLIAKQWWAEVSEEGELAVEPLIQALKDKENLVRGGAAEALGKIGDNRAIEPLIAAMIYDKFSEVRNAAAEALCKIGSTSYAVDSLISSLKHESKDVRRNASERLGNFGDARAVEPLMAIMIYDVFREVQDAAYEALRKINPPSVEDAIEDYQVKKREFEVDEAVKQLVELYDRSPRGEGFLTYSSKAEPVRRIGERINDLGGFQLMLEVHSRFAELRPFAKRNLELVWSGIGNWFG